MVVLERPDFLAADDLDIRILELLGRCRHLKVVATVCDSRGVTGVTAQDVPCDVITIDDLRLTRSDALAWVETQPYTPEPGEIDRILEMVGAVPALLRLAVSAVRTTARGPGRGDRIDRAVEHAVQRYVRTSVLTSVDVVDVPVEVLLRLSAARELTGATAAFLTGGEHADALLIRLERIGVLAHRYQKDGSCWAFVPAIRHALHTVAEESGVDIRRSIETLARFHTDRGDAVAGARLALDAAAWGLVAELVDKHWVEMIAEHMDLLREALEALPPSALSDKPAVAAGRDLFLLAGTQMAFNAPPLPDEAHSLNALGKSPDASELLTTWCVQSLMLRVSGEIREAAEYSRRLALISRKVSETHSDATANLPIMHLQWGITHQLAGDFAESNLELNVAYRSGATQTFDFIARNAAGSLALNWALVGEPKRAQKWLEIERTHAEPIGWMEPKVRVAGIVAQAQIALDRLDTAAAGCWLDELGVVDAGEELWALVTYVRCQHALRTADAHAGLIHLHRAVAEHAATFRNGLAVPLLTAAEVDLRLALGEGTRVLAIARSADPNDPWTTVATARALLLTGSANDALDVTGRHDWLSRHHPRAHVECLLIEAAAHLRNANTTAAATAWRSACQLAESTGLRAPLTTIPSSTRKALADETGVNGELAPLGGSDIFPTKLVVVHLTNREHAVLAELAQGNPISVAAKNLFVSVNTVKSQQRSLYRKLDAHSRDEALAAARTLGLL
ncbi:LuxR family transcriptional regulator [Rhodococcus triatomae BKS 15-14]|nr:LuxR family transcriptional regulator [Rhodococcus triatomae BKS 15-14]